MNNKLIFALIEQFSSFGHPDTETGDVFLEFFKDLDANTRIKLGLLLKLINIVAIFHYFKNFSKLKGQQREKVLSFFAKSPIPKLQGGITGLRSICLVAFYSCEKNRQLIAKTDQT